MSYLVFARKWRPRTFDDVVGQEHITDTLKKAIEKDRVAHAFIFSGTRGVGKTTTARILARALNCENGPTPTPCGECTSCKDILGGSSFDVLEIDGASNNSVNDIRELRENVGYSSMGGKYRIFVIDEVHMLSNAAFNALLKTLEEPPKNVIFIFATTEPQKIPATIHSRCQRYDFRRISAEHILERLVHICDKEGIAYERGGLMLVARKADGSMRDGLSLLDQVYSFCQDNLSESKVRSVLGLVGMEVYNRVMDAIEAKNGAAVLSVVQEVLYQGFDLQEFLSGMQEHLRNLLFARIPDALAGRGNDLDPQAAAQFAASSSRFAEGDLLRMTEITRKTEHELKWSAFPRFAVETMLLKLVYLDRTVSIEQMIKLYGGGAELPVEVAASLANNADEALKKKLVITPELPPVSAAPSPGAPAVLREDPPVMPSGREAIRSGMPLPLDEPAPEEVGEENLLQDEVVPPPEEPPRSEPAAVSALPPVAEPVAAAFGDPSVDEIDIGSLWPKFLEALLRDRPKLGSFLSLATVAGWTAHTIDLRFSPEQRFQYHEVNKKPHRDEIIEVLHGLTQREFDVRMTLETEMPGSAERKYIKQMANVPLTINDEIEKEPIIQAVLDVFDGEIIQ
jgi:DNA polymerase-3 subunit gamma/tau